MMVRSESSKVAAEKLISSSLAPEIKVAGCASVMKLNVANTGFKLVPISTLNKVTICLGARICKRKGYTTS